MKKLLSIVLVLMLLCMSCVSAEKTEAPLKVAMILTGVANDAGWNQIAYEGLCLLRDEYGCEISYTENTLTVNYKGWQCKYITDGKIIPTDTVSANRNGYYKRFVSSGYEKINIKIEIEKL